MVGIINLHDSRFNYSGKGFTSIINQIIEMCLFHYDNFGNFDINVSDIRVEKFFTLPKKEGEQTYNVNIPYLDFFFKNGFPNYNAHNIVSFDDIEKRYFIFDNVFKLKEKFDVHNYDIGIHIRGTDKKNEIVEITFDSIFENINNLIKDSNSLKNIFVATDEYKYIEFIKREFGGKLNVNYNDNVLSYDGNPIHFKDNRELIDYQVLKDVYNLSQCKNLIYCYSNVSLMSIMVNKNKFEKKILLNHIQL